MVYILGIIMILSLSAIIIWSILQSSKEENAKRDKEFINRIRKSALERKPSICIEVDGCKIMLKEDFIKREWYKTKEGGIPIRGQYEPAVHFLKRIDEYRKMKAEQKDTMMRSWHERNRVSWVDVQRLLYQSPSMKLTKY